MTQLPWCSGVCQRALRRLKEPRPKNEARVEELSPSLPGIIAGVAKGVQCSGDSSCRLFSSARLQELWGKKILLLGLKKYKGVYPLEREEQRERGAEVFHESSEPL